MRQRLTFVLRATLFALLALAFLLPLALGAGFVSVLIAPFCGGEITPPMPFESVSFPSAEFDRPTPAYFIPAAQPVGVAQPTGVARSAGAAVIVVPTGAAARGDRSGEIAVYHAAGFHVLSYSSRVCVGGASNTLGYAESFQLADALAYLQTRPEVDPARIGVHGFSAGGAAALMAAARLPQISAVVAMGGYHDFRAEIERSTVPASIFAPLFRFGAFAAYRLTTGHDISVLSPISVIGQIAPRPVLLVYGTNEPGLDGARLQQAAGGSNVELWELPGAAHGDYLVVAPEAFPQRITAFMAAALEAAPLSP